MSSRSIILVFIAFALLAVGCSNAPSSPPAASGDARKFSNLQGNATKGRTAFISTCAACHGQEAKGVPGLGKDLTNSVFTMKLSDADFVLFITKGRPASDALNTTKVDMPPRGGNPGLTDQDLADIVAFIRTLQK